MTTGDPPTGLLTNALNGRAELVNGSVSNCITGLGQQYTPYTTLTTNCCSPAQTVYVPTSVEHLKSLLRDMKTEMLCELAELMPAELVKRSAEARRHAERIETVLNPAPAPASKKAKP